jgi:hypothetical protein
METPNLPWPEICANVRDRMAQHVWPHITPLSRSVSEDRGSALGTGNYILLRDSAYLLTNAHVVREAVGAHLGHLPGPTEDYIGCHNPIQVTDWPFDLALMQLGNEWANATKSAIASSRFDESFSPVEHELVFWLGFPGSTALRHDPVTERNTRYSWFGTLETQGVPVLSQVMPNPPEDLLGYDAGRHAVVHFPARALRRPGEPEVEVPNPQGLSPNIAVGLTG